MFVHSPFLFPWHYYNNFFLLFSAKSWAKVGHFHLGNPIMKEACVLRQHSTPCEEYSEISRSKEFHFMTGWLLKEINLCEV